MSLLIYSDRINARVRYVLEVLFGEWFPLRYLLTDRLSDFEGYAGPRLYYGESPPPGVMVHLPASGYLWQDPLPRQRPVAGREQGWAYLFGLDVPQGGWSFDLPAMIFYLLARVEEYQPFQADAHGRFPAVGSLAFREGFLEQPVLDYWTLRLVEMLELRFPGWQVPRPVYQFRPTYDIDQPWAYRHRRWWQYPAGFLRDVLKLDGVHLRERLAVQWGLRPDPFFTFDQLETLHQQWGLAPRYFFLLADYGARDRSAPPLSPALTALVRQLHAHYQVGIHPSFRAGGSLVALLRECGRLRQMTGEEVRTSRQHFLRLHFPGTYRRLLQAGIRQDFSMGFADRPGFRAGTSRPFPWFDLPENRQTMLEVHPFAVMDVTLRQYLGLSPGEALSQAQQMIGSVRRTLGIFSTLWHNSSFSETHGWGGWWETYCHIAESAR